MSQIFCVISVLINLWIYGKFLFILLVFLINFCTSLSLQTYRLDIFISLMMENDQILVQDYWVLGILLWSHHVAQELFRSILNCIINDSPLFVSVVWWKHLKGIKSVAMLVLKATFKSRRIRYYVYEFFNMLNSW